MTTLISWLAYSNNKQASIYIASDSRFNWDDNKVWDRGRKIYCSSKYPDILGYAGDVVFCSQIISQTITYIDACNIFEAPFSVERKVETISSLIERSLLLLPQEIIANPEFSFSIIYATRESKYSFKAFKMSWDNKNKWSVEALPTDKPGLLYYGGTGGNKYKEMYTNLFSGSDIGGLSRAFFCALQMHVASQADPATGGPLQLAAIFTNGVPKPHGYIESGKRFIYGVEVPEHENINTIRWVNERFENCDGNAMHIAIGEQRQPIPAKILLGKCK